MTSFHDSSGEESGKREDKSQDDTIWYFAIGSMMNPVSMKNRGFSPSESRPGELLDHRLHFFGPHGIAEAQEAPGESLHGVVHRVREGDMAALDRLEFVYRRKRCAPARFYDGEVACVHVYTLPDEERREQGAAGDGPPQQHYIESMIEGAEHFGVEGGYVEFLRRWAYQPRALPLEFKSFGPVPEGAPQMTLEDIEPFDGRDGSPLRTTVNGKVKEVILDGRDGEWDERLLDLYDRFGRVEEMFFSRALFDPKYGCPSSLEDFSREHSAYIEHLSYKMAERRGALDQVKIVGSFRQTFKDENQGDSPAETE